MLNAFVSAFRTPDLRRKLLFVLFIVALFRVGSVVPVPGIDVATVDRCSNQAISGGEGGQSVYGMLNLFSGGALLQMSIFALTIMPYITASIIIQLLTVVIPRLEALKKEGQTGQGKITQYTRYLALGLAVLQSTTMVALAQSGRVFQGIQGCTGNDLIPDQSIPVLVTMVLVMTAGTSIIMWFGELITDRGIGNGMSILIFTSVAAAFPTSLWAIQTSNGFETFLFVIAIGLVVMAAVIFVEMGQRRIPVQYAKRVRGRREYGGSSTYIPLKVNQAGVIPVIFASSLIFLPSMVSQFDPTSEWAQWISQYLVTGDHPLYMAAYFLLIIFFAYFYVGITFNPEDVADNMKKYGGFVPGIRAGKPTVEYLQYVLSRVTAAGALYLGIVALIPLVAIVLVNANQSFPFGGTSILIVVGVGLNTVQQIESQLQNRNYEGFLR